MPGIGVLFLGGITHGGQIDEERDSGEVLEDDAGDSKGDLVVARVTLAFQRANFSTSSLVTAFPSTLRSSDSNTMRMLTGNRERSVPNSEARAGRE
jgi:hypothetical protein